MFELSILWKYLVPKRKHLSVTLIALLSVGVISAVVWLVLVFFSVTEGMEKGWLKKLTSLHAPVRITPTEEYLSSYYYLADTISGEAGYTIRSLDEKLKSRHANIYNPLVDEQIPKEWSVGENSIDPALIVGDILSSMKGKWSGLEWAPFEMGGAMLRLQLLRPSSSGKESESFLTQVSYLSSFSEESSYVKELLLPPTPADIQQLLFQSCKYGALEVFSSQMNLKKVKTSHWHVPFELLPDHRKVPAKAILQGDRVLSIALGKSTHPESGFLRREGLKLFWNEEPVHAPLILEEPTEWKAHLLTSSLKGATRMEGLRVHLEGVVDGVKLAGEASWRNLEVSQASLQETWKVHHQHEKEIKLAKGFYDSGVRIGDRGWLQYHAKTIGAIQEQRVPVVVSGFYDPGVLPIGHKCVLASPEVVHLINTTTAIEHFDKKASMGFCLWHSNFSESEKLARALQEKFDAAGVGKYWKVTTYHDYEFSKDLVQQFQSDRYLFTLIALIVLIVASSNVISLLIVLVQDKKREIGILQALGASKRSIALIFGGCGAMIGFLSFALGVTAAFLTLQNLGPLLQFLGFLQGHAVFNSAFYGSSLPSEMSSSTLIFVMIITPILSTIAGIIPALKACRLSPSEILRAE